ncbi:MAG: amino acid adenylation domain-containing protein [Anaerolinea sp.]|nr:amino acid adenylation domain-containing protein [Anaerolinea sp.]
MSKIDIEAIYPLSPMQEGMLFHSLYAPESGVYVEQSGWVFDGNLNEDALKQAWQQAVDRHPALRTLFIWERQDKPLQAVLPQIPLNWQQHDWRSLTNAAQQAKLQSFLKSDLAQGFDPAKAPLMRLNLIRLSDTTYRFIWSHHHMLLDGWCMSLLLQEVFAYYQAFSQNRQISLPRSRPFRDYISWLQQKDLSEAENFWRHTLKGFTAPTPLLFGQTPTEAPDHEEVFDIEEITLTKTATEKIHVLSRQYKLTVNTLVQGAWAMLLHRNSGEEDVLFGVTVSGRPPDLPGSEAMIGLFINTLPMRIPIQPNQELLVWLRQIQDRQIELSQYEYSPLVQIKAWSEVSGSLPLFESILVFENYPLDTSLLSWGDALTIRDLHFLSRTNYPLDMEVEMGSELTLRLSYNNYRFDRAAVGNMLDYMGNLLQAMAANPTQQLWQLPQLTELETRQLALWNDTQTAVPAYACIHQLFQNQVTQTPDAVAVQWGNEQITYEALNSRANQLAHYLQTLGVGPEVLVGVYLDRSVTMIVAVMGILKAGGAYVPLDPAYPRSRLAFMLADTDAPVLLTQRPFLQELPSFNGRILPLDVEWPTIARQPDHNPDYQVTADNLAYIVYTSGSTQKPRGVTVQHGSLINAYLAWEQSYGLRTGITAHLQMANFAFDVFSGDFVRALCSGAKLVLCPRDSLLEPTALYALMRQTGVDCGEFVPAVIRSLLPYLQETGQNLAFMRLVIVGSDVWHMREWEQLRPFLGPHTRLVNSYGLSEATIDSTYFEQSDHPLPGSKIVPIGRPFANTQLHILDANLQPVATGAPGELHISSPGLARSYLNQPRLTADRFIPAPNSRLYRTGDLCRYLPDGNIEFLGRIDHQIKIRGFRIEPGEIETALNNHPAVQQSIVIVREDTPNNQRLVAYILPTPNTAPTSGQLRRSLQADLPTHMIPSHFVLLDHIPILPNGKVNRRALPPPDPTRLQLDETFAAPRNPVEEELVSIWQKLLNLEQVGIYDNFFELGGHSLLLTQLASRIRKQLQIELPLRTLFKAATIAAMSVAITEKTAEQQPQTSPILPAAPRPGKLPLSFGQQRLWFLSQLEPDSPAYNIPGAVRLMGQLNIPALENSLAGVIDRHEILRTTITTAGDQPVQIIAPAVPSHLPLVDLSQLPGPQREAEVRRLAAEDATRPFNLAQSPLLRATLLRLAPQEHVLLLTMHHIVSDGWSYGIFVEEMATFYETAVNHHPLSLPELPIQYADYAIWQQQQWRSGQWDDQLAYWKKQLDHSQPILHLATDRPRSAVRSYRGASQSLTLPAALAGSLNTVSRQEGATLFMTLLAAFYVLLYRYTMQTDINIGTPIANRHRSEVEGLIGFFVNTLVMRMDLSGNPPFRDFLRRVSNMTVDAYANQDLPFEKLVDELSPRRDLSYSPLFQVMFILQNTPMPELALTGLTLNPINIESGAAKFDLLLTMEETAKGLTGTLDYNLDLFDDATIGRLLTHYQMLLTAVVNNPNQPIDDIPILTGAEKKQLLVEWNATQTAYPEKICIHQQFEAQARRVPDNIAIVFADETLTYQTINNRANQVAHTLIASGVKPETPVGVFIERSPELIIALLGVLKAGGTYLPLDPEYPAARLTFMLEDTQALILLTKKQFQHRLPGHTVGQICLDEEWPLIDAQPITQPNGRITADHAATIIYTSGSTGRPKGVVVSHRAVSNHMTWRQQAYPLVESDAFLQTASASFDISIWQIFAPLQSGGRLVLPRPGEQRDASRLAQLIREQCVTVAHFTPHMLALFLDVPELESLDTLRHVFCGGESLPAPVQERFHARLMANLHHQYGPTEATIDATMWDCTREPGQHLIPIGTPIANTQAYILNHRLQPVPIGVPGHLYLGGVGLARGYHNRPGLTAAHFIPNPFLQDETSTNTRLYKTGDLARFLPDGNIQFLGRADYQVKIRGYRIELGEIEAAINRHPVVSENVTIAHEEASGHKRLVAYLAAPAEQFPTTGELRQFLGDILPDYMIPALFIRLDELPRLPNGKVARHKLPDASGIQPEREKAFIAPRTPMEEHLANIWRQVLNLDQVGVHDNLFELGGDSILTIQIVAKTNAAGIHLSPRHLFQHQTIAELAAIATAPRSITAEQSPVTGPVPLTPIQHWFFAQNLAQHHHWNQSTLLKLTSPLKPDLLETIIKHLLWQHDALRLRFEPEGDSWRQMIIPPDGEVPLTHINLTAVSPIKDALQKAITAVQSSLDLVNGPLLRVTPITFGEAGPHYLLFVVHHLAIDGVSWRILLEDFLTAYQQLTQGRAIQLPPKTTSFKQWAEQLTDYANSESLRRQVIHWAALAHKPANPIPTDLFSRANDEDSTRVVSARLSPAETQTLLQDVHQAYQTRIDDLLLTAVVQTFTCWTGRPYLLIDLEKHGRDSFSNDHDLSRTVGWFTSLFPVFLDLTGIEEDPGEALKTIKEQLRAVPSQGLGYGVLRYLSQTANISTIPQPQISYNYLGQFNQASTDQFELAQELSEPNYGPGNQRQHLLDLVGQVIGGQFQMDFLYSINFHKPTTIEQLAQDFTETVRTLMAHCLHPEAGGYTPSDFPTMQFDQEELDDLLAELGDFAEDEQ